MENIWTIVKKYWIIAILIGIVLVSSVFKRQISRLLGIRKKPIKHGAAWYRTHKRPLPQRLKSGRSFPRSVGTKSPRRKAATRNKPAARRSTSGRGYPAAGGGYIPFKRNKDGSIKKAAFVGGTLAAKRRMAQLRKQR